MAWLLISPARGRAQDHHETVRVEIGVEISGPDACATEEALIARVQSLEPGVHVVARPEREADVLVRFEQERGRFVAQVLTPNGRDARTVSTRRHDCHALDDGVVFILGLLVETLESEAALSVSVETSAGTVAVVTPEALDTVAVIATPGADPGETELPPRAEDPAPVNDPPLRLSLALGGTTAWGALPAWSIGAEATLALTWRFLRVEARVHWLGWAAQAQVEMSAGAVMLGACVESETSPFSIGACISGGALGVFAQGRGFAVDRSVWAMQPAFALGVPLRARILAVEFALTPSVIALTSRDSFSAEGSTLFEMEPVAFMLSLDIGTSWDL